MIKCSALLTYLAGFGVLLIWVPETSTLGGPGFHSDSYGFVWDQNPMYIHYQRIIYYILWWSWFCAVIFAASIGRRSLTASLDRRRKAK